MTNKPAETERFFSYGTLQSEAVQRATFGRILSGAPDALVGYALSMVRVEDPAVVATSGEAFHPIIKCTRQASDVVNGTVFAITPQELLKADAYEVNDYQRISVILSSGARAWVYVQVASTDAASKELQQMMMKKLLFIQGAGEGAYIEDRALADYLKTALGPEYELAYPKFSGLESVAYDAWRNQARVELENLGEEGIIVAHSLGGAALLKYLSEEAHDLPIAGLFLIAAPYKGQDGEWGTDDFAMEVSFASSLPAAPAVFLYHSQDDEWVPFSHLAQWAEKMPHSVVRQFDDRGHSFSREDFVELVEDIRALRPRFAATSTE